MSICLNKSLINRFYNCISYISWTFDLEAADEIGFDSSTLVKWSTSEYGWLSSAITLERSSIRTAKALSLIEINDTQRGLVDDSGTFFLHSDRWLRWWDLRVIVYSTLIKYTRCLRSSFRIISIDSVQITARRRITGETKLRMAVVLNSFSKAIFVYFSTYLTLGRYLSKFQKARFVILKEAFYDYKSKVIPDEALISLFRRSVKKLNLRSRRSRTVDPARPSFQWSPYKGRARTTASMDEAGEGCARKKLRFDGKKENMPLFLFLSRTELD